jgi:hypothetical protein
MRVIRWILGFLAGYAAVVLITEFGFRLFPDRPIHHPSVLVIAGAGMVAVVAGLAGGALAAWISRSRVVGWLVLLPLVAETYWLLFLRRSEPPADWRDAAAALTLLAAVAAGAYFASKTTSPPTTV